MKFVWPIILGAMEAREKKIAAGLAAAEKGQQELSQARSNSDSIIREARDRAQQIIDQAQHRANEIVDQAKAHRDAGRPAAGRAAAQQQIDLEANRAREEPAQGSGDARRDHGVEAARSARSMRARMRT